MTENSASAADQAVARQACDKLLELATETMVIQAGAPVEMVIDRLVTYAAAQICSIEGSKRAAEVFRDVADKIDAGLFHRITGEPAPKGRAH
jgi:hypothetical protein